MNIIDYLLSKLRARNCILMTLFLPFDPQLTTFYHSRIYFSLITGKKQGEILFFKNFSKDFHNGF